MADVMREPHSTAWERIEALAADLNGTWTECLSTIMAFGRSNRQRASGRKSWTMQRALFATAMALALSAAADARGRKFPTTAPAGTCSSAYAGCHASMVYINQTTGSLRGKFSIGWCDAEFQSCLENGTFNNTMAWRGGGTGLIRK